MLLATFPLAFLLLACAAVSILLRSLIFLFGPEYLHKRASTHFRLASRSELLDQKYADRQSVQKTARKEQVGDGFGL